MVVDVRRHNPAAAAAAAAVRHSRPAMAGSWFDRTNNRCAGPSSQRHESSVQNGRAGLVDSMILLKNHGLLDGVVAWQTGKGAESMTDRWNTDSYGPKEHDQSQKEEHPMVACCPTCWGSRDTRRAYFPVGVLRRACRGRYPWSF